MKRATKKLQASTLSPRVREILAKVREIRVRQQSQIEADPDDE